HLPLPLQGKLLRVLDEKRIRRVGGTQSRTVDVRIITATNVDLAAAVKRGEFREDLFYRLNVVALTLPPLRDRGDDIELLAATFVSSLAVRYGVPAPALTPAVRSALRAHEWPGNVRELRHAIERALLLSDPGTIDPAQLALGRGNGSQAPTPHGDRLAEIIFAAVKATVEACSGNRTMAARRLGISRQRLQRILERADDGST
ncbi:MAG: sigma 54-interacting transcriptional regulator, partial [Gemmatimonadetes bacterium]|nr:sigma 54-interacting transcriptional regulator [Gemmatimonadota bacterium]